MGDIHPPPPPANGSWLETPTPRGLTKVPETISKKPLTLQARRCQYRLLGTEELYKPSFGTIKNCDGNHSLIYCGMPLAVLSMPLPVCTY